MTATRPPRGRPTGPDSTPSERNPNVARVPVRRIFAAENRDFFLLLGITLFLVIFGLVMVLSASFVEAKAADENATDRFVRQAMFAAIGLPAMFVASRFTIKFWKRWAWPALLVGAALQLLVFVPGIGFGYGGNQNWIRVGSFSMQPSEFVKIAIIVWVAWVLTAKRDLIADWKHLAIPIAPVAGTAIGLVLLGKDLGTATIMILIVFGCLYFAGAKLRHLGLALVAVALGGIAFAMTSQSRSDRISIWINGCAPEDYQGLCWQVQHGTWALASGGLFGVGLGNSKAKWNWLPEADNDFIFAIIGEELGLIGAVVVIALFVVLAIAFVRIIRGTTDNFARIVTGGVMIWVVGQALVNIAVVLGLLPVLGVPLPLISAGGSALIANLIGIGIVLSFAREAGSAPKTEPDNSEAVSQTAADRARLLAERRASTRRS